MGNGLGLEAVEGNRTGQSETSREAPNEAGFYKNRRHLSSAQSVPQRICALSWTRSAYVHTCVNIIYIYIYICTVLYMYLCTEIYCVCIHTHIYPGCAGCMVESQFIDLRDPCMKPPHPKYIYIDLLSRLLWRTQPTRRTSYIYRFVLTRIIGKRRNCYTFFYSTNVTVFAEDDHCLELKDSSLSFFIIFLNRIASLSQSSQAVTTCGSSVGKGKL